MVYLQITLAIAESNRGAVAEVYAKYKGPFLSTIPGATSKDLLVRKEDVQVLHCFDSEQGAKAYLESEMFQNDVVRELGPLLSADPDVRIYSVV
ncbi:hypothetical protein K7566_11255 [Stenotrophomonas maltophilia]|uniref:hypothetical protein n=1 Tax=Stenotrophomonas maltophilia TaxID=40324 RepID=UPI000C14DCA6|nr:hypothetical protein [Stenotrophomonas maltophilia]UXB18200.1 hypothetical protein K7566_11255 [Stenotrophomonas maltophilia]